MPAPQSVRSVAAIIARMLRARGVERVFALCGGHIMPIWMALDVEGISIIDVRDERAAVHMAQAHAELTGRLGVALVTAGPGVTNATTGIANAEVSRAPVLVLSGCPPRQQLGRGALQDMDHPTLVRPITRYAQRIGESEHAPRALDAAISAALGEGGVPGPAFIDFPTDTLRAVVPDALAMPEHMNPCESARLRPDPRRVDEAVDLIFSAKRPIVISGRGARGCGKALIDLLDRIDAVYLDTSESRGLVPEDHPSVAASMRGAVMQEADLVVTVGRKLDFQLAYGSPAIFGDAAFVRLADNAEELSDNRRGAVGLLADVGASLEAIVAAASNRTFDRDGEWLKRMRDGHRERVAKLRGRMRAAEPGSDGRMHPNRLLAAIQDEIGTNSIAIVDGGDFLSFARVGLSASTMLDPGPFGCIGVGVPYGIAAALACPDRKVIVATGDGAFGFNAIEIDTAARHKAAVVFVVANNGAWQIEVHDQATTHGKVVGTRLQFADHAAMARALGLHAERVEDPADLPDALRRAFANRPALLDVVVTPEAVSSDARTGLAWVPDLQPLAVWDEAEREWRRGKRESVAATIG